MARFLVTGASGFIGQHLAAHLLCAGHDVTCLVRISDRLPKELAGRVRVAQGDVRDRASLAEAVAGAEYVVHLAGLVKSFHAQELMEINAGGTRNVASACAEVATPPTLVFVSSLAAAGPSRRGEPLRESDRPAPVSDYGRSKLAAETLLQEQAARLPVTIVRPAIVFGSGDSNSFAMFQPISKLGMHAVPGMTAATVSLIHSADLCRLLLLAAERGERLATAAPGSGIYFGALQDAIRYDELGQMIARALGRPRVKLVHNRAWSGFALAGLSEVIGRLRRRPPIFNLDKAREAYAGDWYCSAEKAYQQLGFRPAASLAERLAETVAWYREQGWLPVRPCSAGPSTAISPLAERGTASKCG